MKASILVLGLIIAKVSLANDHNNIEHGRPLLFDDAYSIAYGEREFQVGAHISSGRLGFMSSLGYGFAKNQEVSFGIEATRGTSTIGEVSYFRNISREFEHSAALGFRLTANSAPGAKPAVQARFIATKALRQYDKVHLNIDVDTDQSPGVILGYSSPLGYPKQFDQSLVAELGFQHSETIAGIGIRRQLDPRSILDVGIEAGKILHFTVGYSIAF